MLYERVIMGRLKVYYGWARIGKIRKKRAISVIFENEWHGCRCDRGQRILRAAQETVIERYQDAEEEKAAKDCTRIFTECDKIEEALRKAFLKANRGYKEPCGQLTLNFE